MKLNKQQLERYNQRISELKIEFESLSVEVAKKKDVNNTLELQISEKMKKNTELDSVIESKQQLISVLTKTFIKDSEHCKKIIEKKSSYIDVLSKEIRGLIANRDIIVKQIEELLKKRKTEGVYKELKDNLSKEIAVLQKKINELEKELSSKQIKLVKIAQETNEKIKELDEKIALEKRIHKDNSEMRAKIDLYGKRLQAYYDESGIKLSILKELGIK